MDATAHWGLVCILIFIALVGSILFDVWYWA